MCFDFETYLVLNIEMMSHKFGFYKQSKCILSRINSMLYEIVLYWQQLDVADVA